MNGGSKNRAFFPDAGTLILKRRVLHVTRVVTPDGLAPNSNLAHRKRLSATKSA